MEEEELAKLLRKKMDDPQPDGVCMYCEGSGKFIFLNGPVNMEERPCRFCQGTGRRAS